MKKRGKAKRIEIPSLELLEAEHKRYKYRTRYRQTLRSTVGVLLTVAALAVLVATLWMPVLRIYGSSMSPSLEDGQIVVCVKGDEYAVGDLVAFYYGNKLLIKRVIAAPGDWISIQENGDVYVNDVLLDEPYVQEKALGECDQQFPLQISDEHWFLMGDNRVVSLDSRSTMVGCVSEEQIIGKIVLRVWPVDSMGFLDKREISSDE